MYTLLIALMAIMLISCTTTDTLDNQINGIEKQYDDRAEVLGELFDEFNEYEGTVCIGISGPYTSKKLGYQKAIENCAKYLALYEQVEVHADYDTMQEAKSSTNVFELFEKSGTSKEKMIEAISDLEIVEKKWFGGEIGAVVFARLPSTAKRIHIPINWKERSPFSDLEQNLVGAKSMKNYTRLTSSIEAAIFQSAFLLLDIAHDNFTVVFSETNTTTTNYISHAHSITLNSFKGFRIIALDYDPHENKVYALASYEK